MRKPTPPRYPYPRGGNGWYRLPSGQVIHLQAEKPPTAETMAALDELAQAAIRKMQSERESS